MPEITDRPEWAMPGWMEPYRAGFTGVGPQDVEEYYNDDTPAPINAVRALMGAQVKAQVDLLVRLHQAGLLEQPKACLDRNTEGHVCDGLVRGRPSIAGTGTLIYRCPAGHAASARYKLEVLRKYPDTDTAPKWFDPAYAGERWNEDD
ncbi:hypothetical protein AB0B15_02910 [Streptomyces sp. NPDC045456]|uniref:hypothetical protein n=1 Tax=Streptomyces sp. NPDC045456 TaxID=3155254 RepID=UPI0033C181B7